MAPSYWDQTNTIKSRSEVRFEPGPLGAKDYKANAITITPRAYPMSDFFAQLKVQQIEPWGSIIIFVEQKPWSQGIECIEVSLIKPYPFLPFTDFLFSSNLSKKMGPVKLGTQDHSIIWARSNLAGLYVQSCKAGLFDKKFNFNFIQFYDSILLYLLCISTSFWVLRTPESWSNYFFSVVFYVDSNIEYIIKILTLALELFSKIHSRN